MPTRTSYASSTAIIHADGSIGMGGYVYTWNGSLFVKSTTAESSIASASAVDATALEMANDIEVDFWGRYDLNGPHTGVLNPQQIATLRIAIEKGYTTLEKALTFFGDMHAMLIRPWAFQAELLPSTLTAEQEGTILAPDVTGLVMSVREVLTKPSSFIDSNAHPTTGYPWSVAPGTSPAEAIGDAWVSSTVASIASAAALLTSDPSLPTADAAVDFALTPTAHADWIQKAYLAFFLRPADGTGFNYYAEKMNTSGGDFMQMTSGFGFSPEYLETYAGLTTAQRINTIYLNLFNRSAEPDGLEYWGSRLDNGTFTINNIAISILVGAQNSDAVVVSNRVAVAVEFTNSFDTWDKVNAYSGQQSAAEARALLANVTEAPGTVAQANLDRAAVFKTLGAAATVTTGSAGDTITLTSASAHDIVVLSPLSNAGKVDKIIGFAGDTLDLSSFSLPSTSVVVIQDAPIQTVASASYFSAAKVVIGHTGNDSWLYVDVDKNGAFDPTKDAVVHLVGTNLLPSDLSI
ncbi:MAG: hypothetical protein K0Q43_154 [Ramlibacter sp.]|jgi:hypothetical protein|nr:hypothetical protein [Ramlibacter sp.]